MNAAARNAGLASATTNNPRWACVVAREKAADGKFYYHGEDRAAECRMLEEREIDHRALLTEFQTTFSFMRCAKRPKRPDSVRARAANRTNLL